MARPCGNGRRACCCSPSTRPFRAFQFDYYYSAPYLSPFYSPCLTTGCAPEASDFGQPISWWPLSPALIILIFPLGFRLTCYYYRKAYYRAFWFSPPACAVAEPHKRYTGETRFPLIVQNIHRYFWYAAMVFGVILTYDAILGFRNADGEWGHMGLGTVILLINAALIWLYTLSCHSCRHIMGGKLKHFSKHPLRYKAWQQISKLNATAHVAGLGVADLAGSHRLLHLPAGHRHHHRPEVLLNCQSPSDTAPPRQTSVPAVHSRTRSPLRMTDHRGAPATTS